jgi:DEAD/DEAH box helicase domain-containing protein
MEDLESKQGLVTELLAWIVAHEAALQSEFLSRFGPEVRDDTRERFVRETETERLFHRIRQAADEFGIQIRSIETARRRLTDDKKELANSQDDAGLRDVERELRILRARMATLNRLSALEVLTEHGLLPNYAFPERGVRLAGTVYRDRQGPAAEENSALTIDVTRAAAVAIRELAPGNKFYTHGHEFEIQQLSIGTQAQPLVRTWAICGKCGHMRPTEELERSDTKPACPQCNYDKQQHSQMDRAQWKPFLKSSALTWCWWRVKSISAASSQRTSRRGGSFSTRISASSRSGTSRVR